MESLNPENVPPEIQAAWDQAINTTLTVVNNLCHRPNMTLDMLKELLQEELEARKVIKV